MEAGNPMTQAFLQRRDSGGTEEERKTSDTGGQKGHKLCRLDLAPPVALIELGNVYGYGAKKYSEHNWRKGYPWSWSMGAMMRHILAFWAGENIDPDSGLPHLAHVMWHAATLMEFGDIHPSHDDRMSRKAVTE